MVSLPERLECPWILRAIFNDGQYVERAQKGELAIIIRDEHPAPAAARQPAGTIARFLQYVDSTGTLQAMAFHYARPDQAWKPDPKWIRIDSEILRPSHDDGDTCPNRENRRIS